MSRRWMKYLKFDFFYIQRLGRVYAVIINEVQEMHFKVRYVYPFAYNNPRNTTRVFVEFDNERLY
jgi:hypothetical protein